MSRKASRASLEQLTFQPPTNQTGLKNNPMWLVGLGWGLGFKQDEESLKGQFITTLSIDTLVTLSTPQAELIPVMVSVGEHFLSGL